MSENPIVHTSVLPSAELLEKLVAAAAQGVGDLEVGSLSVTTNIQPQHFAVPSPNQPQQKPRPTPLKVTELGKDPAVTQFIGELRKRPYIEVKSVSLSAQNHPGFTYQAQDGLTATITINKGQSQNAQSVMKLLDALAEQFTLQTRAVAAADLLTSADKARVTALETTLVTLQGETAKISSSVQTQTQALSTFLLEKQTQLDAAHKARLDALEKEYATKAEALKTDREKLEGEKKKFDDRDRTHVRRDLLDKLKQIIEKQREPKLSAATEAKQQKVEWTFRALMILAVLATIGFAVAAGYSEIGWRFLIPAGAWSAIFLSTFFFYLRWCNHWFERHARAEFANSKFESDVTRASWLAELFFEWKEEKKLDFPAELITSFTQDLFRAVEWSKSPQHPLEQILSMAQRASKIRVDKTGFEIERTKAKE
jgi:hypothetical protein